MQQKKIAISHDMNTEMRDNLLLRGGKLQEDKPDSDDSDFSANMDVASE